MKRAVARMPQPALALPEPEPQPDDDERVALDHLPFSWRAVRGHTIEAQRAELAAERYFAERERWIVAAEKTSTNTGRISAELQGDESARRASWSIRDANSHWALVACVFIVWALDPNAWTCSRRRGLYRHSPTNDERGFLRSDGERWHCADCAAYLGADEVWHDFECISSPRMEEPWKAPPLALAGVA